MKLLYIMDPLCGWCYGNSANMLRLERELAGKLEIEVLPGGMWTGENARYQSAQLASFIRPADAKLRMITRVELSDAYDRLLDDTRVLLDSEPGCRAINTMKQLSPELTLSFASAIARTRYIDGLDNTILATFLGIVEKIGISPHVFRELFESDTMKTVTQETFERAGEYTHSYPSMFLESSEEIFPIGLHQYQYDGILRELQLYLSD